MAIFMILPTEAESQYVLFYCELTRSQQRTC